MAMQAALEQLAVALECSLSYHTHPSLCRWTPDQFAFFQFGSCQMYQSVPSVSMMTVPSPE